MIFGNRSKKEKRTLKEYNRKKVNITRVSAKKTKKTHFFSRFMFYFLILVFVGTTGYLIFFSGFLAISNIEIQNNEIVKSEDIQKIIVSKLEEKYFNFLEKNNLILFSSHKIKSELLKEFKIIKQVDVKKDFPNGIKISILERKPQLILESANEKWVIDEEGKIFDKAQENYSYLEQNNLPVIFDESNKKYLLGDLAMDEKYISFISDFRKKVRDEIEIEFENEIRIPSISSGGIKMKTKEGWMIFLDENIGADKEKEMLQTVLENKIAKEKRPDLEYIDLRILNKVFYKFKEGTPEAVSQNENNPTSVPPVANTSKKESKKKN